MNKKTLLLLLSVLSTGSLHAQKTETNQLLQQESALTDSLSPTQHAHQLLLHGTLQAAPLVGIGLLQTIHNEEIRTIRYGHYPNFRHHFDDYLQFAPLAAQLGLRIAGVEGSSRSVWQTFTADIAATTAMLAVTSAIKYTARVKRPDGSSRNSFPSGHTAMAFTSAALLSLEYGERYPWMTPVSYGLASLTGLGRILNNRHWIGDVITGAGLGILSAHVGYWVSDLLFGGSKRRLILEQVAPKTRLRLYAPLTLSATPTEGEGSWGLQGRDAALGVEYTPAQWPIYLRGQVGLSIYRGHQGGEGAGRSAHERNLSLRVGVGRDLMLWRGFYVAASATTSLRHLLKSETSTTPLSPRLSMPTSSVGVGIEVAPRWYFTKHIGLRLPLGLDYYPSSYQLTTSQRSWGLSPVSFYGGTALEVYL